mmetsp:Transcript_67417/g.186680  ORF Transcript_67417/g.186680 Transcript_67417/m.186680 type:complete len:106 (-) Transcript_67417:2-319(-)
MAAASESAVTNASALTDASSVARFTLACMTPGTALSVFSTRMTQEAQVIPVTWSLIPSGLDSVAVFMSASMCRSVFAHRQGSNHRKVKSTVGFCLQLEGSLQVIA